MPVPQPVLDVLNSLQIFSADPTFRNPGDLLNLSIKPDPLDAMNALLGAPEVIANLNLTMLLNGVVSPQTVITASPDRVGPSATPVMIDVDNSTGFSAGGVALIDAGTAQQETQPIIAVPSGTQITVLALTFAHDGSDREFPVATNPIVPYSPIPPDLSGVSKAVEFAGAVEPTAAQLDAGQADQNKLAYLLPTGIAGTGLPNYVLGGAVEGLISKLRVDISGAIPSSIFGTITKAILNAAPQITITWHVRDSSGADLRPGLDFVMLGAPAAGGQFVAPIFVFLPSYGELTFGPQVLIERMISCDVEVSCADPTFDITRTLGPLSIQVPQVQIPTMVAFTPSSHVVFGGSIPPVLLCVPGNSAVTDPSKIVSLLTTVMGFLTAIGSIVPSPTIPAVPPVFSNFMTAAGVIGMILPFLAAGVANFQKADGNGNLFWIWFPGTFSNEIGGAIMIGPPGRVVRCFKDSSDFWTGNYVARDGAIDITVGPTGTVSVSDFSSGMPPMAIPAIGDPSDSTCTVVVAAGLANFDHLMNAYQFR